MASREGDKLITSVSKERVVANQEGAGSPLHDAVLIGSQQRLRPVMMASLAAGIGLLPAALATGIGSETQQPLARVVVGGMLTAPVLTLVVLPALYLFVHRFAEGRSTERAADVPDGALAN